MNLETDLLRPEAYGPLRPQRVEQIETHLSRVFLLERDVFKVKRPVDLGFVDFTTLARREAACRADAATRARADATARRHLLLALSMGRRPLVEPRVVAVGGVIASGKSTVAEGLADSMSAPIVEADRTRKAMAGVAPCHPLREAAWQGAYDPAVTERVYAELVRRAGVILASGRPVVLDASFRSPSMRASAKRLALAHGVPFHFVECRADADTCRSRLAQRARGPGVSDGRLEIFDAFFARFDPVTELPPAEHLVIDTTLPVELSLGALRSRLETWPRGFVA